MVLLCVSIYEKYQNTSDYGHSEIGDTYFISANCKWVHNVDWLYLLGDLLPTLVCIGRKT